MVGSAYRQGGKEAMLELHRAGELGAARAGYERLLAAAPGDADLLGLLGVLALQEERAAEAEQLLARALESPSPDPRIDLRNRNNLFAAMQAQGREDAARALAGAELPDWPADAPPCASERTTLMSLAEALTRYGQPERGLSLLESVLDHFGEDAEALTLAGALRLKCDRAEAALPVLQRASAGDPSNWQALANLSLAHEALGQPTEAREAARRCARAAPVFLAPERSGQQATILVLNQAPGRIPHADRGLQGLHFTKNYISQISSELAGEFRFASVFADLPGPLPDLPAADVVFNNLASGEAMNVPGALDRAIDVTGRIGHPVINHPNAVFETTRQKGAALLQGIPGLHVPRIERYQRDMARFDEISADIAQNFAYPLILRHVGADESSHSLLSEHKTAMLVQDEAGLRDALAGVGWAQFYAIQYVDLRKPDGNFRKLRAAFFPDEIVIIACGYYSDWMVSGWRHNAPGQAYYAANPHRVADMHRTLRDPAGVLGTQLMPVLEAIRDRLPLEVFGLDFDIDDEGQVVFFEAQATMILLMPRAGVPDHLQLPIELYDRVNEAFRRMVRRKIAEAG